MQMLIGYPANGFGAATAMFTATDTMPARVHSVFMYKAAGHIPTVATFGAEGIGGKEAGDPPPPPEGGTFECIKKSP
jgi:hypothetical protein